MSVVTVLGVLLTILVLLLILMCFAWERLHRRAKGKTFYTEVILPRIEWFLQRARGVKMHTLSRPIKVTELENYVQDMERDSNYQYSLQFELSPAPEPNPKFLLSPTVAQLRPSKMMQPALMLCIWKRRGLTPDKVRMDNQKHKEDRKVHRWIVDLYTFEVNEPSILQQTSKEEVDSFPEVSTKFHEYFVGGFIISDSFYQGHSTPVLLEWLFKWLDHNLEDVGKDLPCLTGNQPENKCKNRYFNILPYDSNQVKLDAGSTTESNYINASYVKGKSGAKHYIATQGPLPCTQAHFWQMVWEQQVSMIIMLTKCKERLKVKCEPYWPEGKAMEKYGDFAVTLLSEIQQSNWIVRSFIISHQDEGEREVRHFQYLAWPDKGTPINSHVSGLVELLKKTRLAAQLTNVPILVHCSAGVGRTGTFIALDQVLSDLESGSDNIDFMALVAELRWYRTGMVQTEEQYAFIHTCTLEMWRQLQQTQNDGQKENSLCSSDETREAVEPSNGTEDANDLSVPTIVIHPASEETQLLATNEQTHVGDNPVLLDDDPCTQNQDMEEMEKANEGENELSKCNNSSQAQ